MPDHPSPEPAGGFNIGDIYFVLFRHKWKILFFSVLGIVSAGAILLIWPAPYQSEMRLLVKYVQPKVGTGPGNDAPARLLDERPDAVFNTEIEFLRSRDLALIVVTNLGPERILAKLGGGADFNRAAAVISDNLIAEPPTRKSVITIAFQHPDKDLVQPALSQILQAYINKHGEMNQQVAFDPVALVRTTNSLVADITRLDEQLRAAKKKAGVTFLDEERKAANEQYSEAKKKLRDAEGDLAQHRALLANLSPGQPETTNAAPVAGVLPASVIEEYNNARGRIARFKEEKEKALDTYLPASDHIQLIQRQINDAQALKDRLEKENPGLTTIAAAPTLTPTQANPSGFDPSVESATVRALEASTNYWNKELGNLRGELDRIELNESPIRDLELKKKNQEDTLRNLLAQAQLDSLKKDLGADNDQRGLKVVESPRPAVKKWSKTFQNKVAMVAVGGIGFGLALAFLIELVLDRSVKRAVEIESKLKLPLFISIPDVSRNGQRRRAPAASGDSSLLPEVAGVSGNGGVEPWDKRHALHRFYGGLRDRLIVYFEVRNLVHKPKLVAVTSCNKGAGVSTIAAGLAASLSQTGDGNVLLVDMNEEQSVAQQFHKGSPGCGLDMALESETMKTALVEGNLYVATDRQPAGKLQRVPHGHLANLMPKLKASDYDYIIFDMPAVTQTSTTARLSGLMDMVLLVIESEKTNQDVVKRAMALLGESKATVSTVLNKTHAYVPARLHQDTLSDG